MLAITNIEDIIQLLQRKILGLWKEKVTEYPAKNVPACVPTKSACAGEGCFEGRPCQGKDEFEALCALVKTHCPWRGNTYPSRCSGERHSDITNVQRKGFGAVGERH